jgi:hypothetical protein
MTKDMSTICDVYTVTQTRSLFNVCHPPLPSHSLADPDRHGHRHTVRDPLHHPDRHRCVRMAPGVTSRVAAADHVHEVHIWLAGLSSRVGAPRTPQVVLSRPMVSQTRYPHLALQCPVRPLGMLKMDPQWHF